MRILSVGSTTTARRGGALAASLIIVVALSGIAAGVFSMSLARNMETREVGESMRALYAAEAGITESLVEIAVKKQKNLPVPPSLGSLEAPVTQRNGKFFASVVADPATGSFRVTSTGLAGTSERTIRAIIAPTGGSAFDHAIFAGNSSNDPTYALELSGVGSEADMVTGDIYSGNDVDIQGDASVSGTIFANGSIQGATGQEGINRPPLDIEGMDYSTNHDFDVAAMFAVGGVRASSPLGGDALQLPETSPAHIFRLNPDNRTDETDSTPKDDFFLEDPYESVTDWTAGYSNEDGHTVSVSGIDGEPGPSGNDAVYYIDGNLWVHNTNWKPMRFNHDSVNGTKVTFVVRGNVYFSDDVNVTDPVRDGLAFIAIVDENEPDSGNIYLGDPRFGTVEMLQTFLYAENNFIDNNLDEDGSKDVTIAGNMTAGNHVAIQRNFVKPDGTVVHSTLNVDFDDRISTGAIELPGIPMARGGLEGYSVVFWREVAAQ